MASSISSAAILLTATVLLSLFTTPVSASDHLKAGQFLKSGKHLSKGEFSLEMQKDCNVVLKRKKNPIWATNTNGLFTWDSECWLKMQEDGNLVLYSGKNVNWATNTNRENGHYILKLMQNGNFVIFDEGDNIIWTSHTGDDGIDNVVIARRNGTAAESGVAHNKVTELHH